MLQSGLRRDLRHQGLIVHRIVRGPLSHRLVMRLSDTVFTRSGQPAFVVSDPIYWRRFETLFSRLPLPSGWQIGIVRPDGYLEARAPIPGGHVQKLFAHPESGRLTRILMRHPDRKQGVFVGPMNGTRRYAAFVRVPGYPLVAFADVPQSVWFASWWHSQGEIPLAFLVAALAFSLWAYHRIQALSHQWERETQRRQSALRDLILQDPLTGLLNRSGLTRALRRAVARARRQHRLLAVGFIDLDNFKDINDHYGHPAGDQVLKELALRLQKALRATDVIARLGGDEFVILVESLRHPADLKRLLAKLKTVLERPYSLSDEAVVLRASLGMTLCPPDEADAEDLLRHADQAMYEAKSRSHDDPEAWVRFHGDDATPEGAQD